ncbi:MAG: tRNA (adenosine(37)-N6)-dimethylallyltransferase MiaA [Bacteroidales bacterium]
MLQTITILGPTATGKTRLATRLANEIGAEIVSADSRQVYRSMDLGTGKDLADYEIEGIKIPYHLIDLVEPGTEYNVFQYQQAAHKAMREIEKKGKKIILCGGSGMYIEAILKGYKLFPVPENIELRNTLAQKPIGELIQILTSFRSLHNHTDTCEYDRLTRAIEIELYYQQHPEIQEFSQPVSSVIFGLKGDRDLIRTRITKRLKERLENGMIEEVENLIKTGVNQEQLIRYGLEYKYITLYLQRQIDYETLFTKLNTAIHQFSKRQMTWFRKMERSGFNIYWIDIALSEEEKLAEIFKIYNPK